MSFIEFEWEPKPAFVAEQYFAAAAALEDLEIPLAESLPVVAAGIDQVFAQEGPGWAGWAESYAPIAEQENVGILEKTGALRSGAASEGSLAVEGHAIFFTGAGAPDYWIFHEEGTSKMPARPFVTLTPESEEGVMEIFAAWLDSVVGFETTGRGQTILRGPGGRFIPQG